MAIEEHDLRPDLTLHTHEGGALRGTDVDLLSVNTIRTLAMDAVEAAGSGHPGTPMALAPLAYVLLTRFLKHDPSDPGWPDRDRFVLSAGHASMLLYAVLHLTGYDLPLEELERFRRWGSRCPGHPERGITPGVEVTTGPLGQGVANAVGMAIAERMLAARFDRPGHEVVGHHTYGICSDGDLMEGRWREGHSTEVMVMAKPEFPAPEEGMVLTHLLIVEDQDRSRDFYTNVLGAEVVLERDPVILQFHNSWIIINVGGGPTEDKPDVEMVAPQDPNRVSACMNIRVADVHGVYEDWKAKGGQFLTPPQDRGREIRCYLRDPDGHLIEVGQARMG